MQFVKAESTTGEALANTFIESLNDMNVAIHQMRGQGYDGAANMKGKNRGVQARILEPLPQAEYTHCTAHVLNLCIVHSCTIPVVRNLMDTVQQISFAFGYSAKRQQLFEENLEQNPDRHTLERRQKIVHLCETRWAARAEALTTFMSAYYVAVDVLDELGNSGDAKCAGYAASIQRFEFIICLLILEHVLTLTAELSKFLQSKSIDLIQAANRAAEVVEQLKAERNDDQVYAALYEKAVQMSAEVGVLPCKPRSAKRQMHRNNVEAETPFDYWKRSVYLPFIDHMISELIDGLLKPKPRFCAQYLLPRMIPQLNDDVKRAIFDVYSHDITNNMAVFQHEITMWELKWRQTPLIKRPETLLDTLDSMPCIAYPNLYNVLCILCVMPVSTATAERSFSSMRRIKTYLRSTMTDESFSALALLHIHREMDINLDFVVQTFSNKKNRRITLPKFK